MGDDFLSRHRDALQDLDKDGKKGEGREGIDQFQRFLGSINGLTQLSSTIIVLFVYGNL